MTKRLRYRQNAVELVHNAAGVKVWMFQMLRRMKKTVLEIGTQNDWTWRIKTLKREARAKLRVKIFFIICIVRIKM